MNIEPDLPVNRDYLCRYDETLPHESALLMDVLAADEIQQLFDEMQKVTVIPMSIIDLNANVLFSSPWQRVCSNFYRINAETCANCIASDTVLSRQTIAANAGNGPNYHLYACKNGLNDCVSPIVLDGQHVANLFTGQFLTEDPSEAFFLDQAERYGFDRLEFMQAVQAIPVVPREKLEDILRFLSRLTKVITRLCLERIRAKQAEAKVRELNLSLENMVAERTNELRAVVHKLENLASHDPLTRAFNRRYFESALEQEIGRAKRYGRPFSLIMFDLDHFKLINDNFGHATGDKVLTLSVESAQACLRQNDLLARWGGEEFTIILPETALPQAEKIAERIRQGIAQCAMIPGQPVTCSLGVVQWSGESDEVLLVKADAAMYAAKSGGRNRVVGYDQQADGRPVGSCDDACRHAGCNPGSGNQGIV